MKKIFILCDESNFRSYLITVVYRTVPVRTYGMYSEFLILIKNYYYNLYKIVHVRYRYRTVQYESSN